MKTVIKMTVFLTMLVMANFSPVNRLEAACTYVTDTGGFAYDECRAATNLAPAIALSTVALVAVIAMAVQNSHHEGGSSHSHVHACTCD